MKKITAATIFKKISTSDIRVLSDSFIAAPKQGGHVTYRGEHDLLKGDYLINSKGLIPRQINYPISDWILGVAKNAIYI